ncbi:MAG: acetoacetate--CoA ligase [Anaerolineae bacterium]
MKEPLWEPSEERKSQANLTRFIRFVNEEYGLGIESYFQLHSWSVEDIPDFWAAMWDFGQIRASLTYAGVVDDLSKFPGAKWFAGARLNFAENLLRHRDDHLAFIFQGETRKSAKMTYAELHDRVARLARSLREMGVTPGDVVAAYMPNLIETAVAMLAATSVGAIWASCATDLGPRAALDRLGQVQPKVLFTADGYFHKDRVYDTRQNAAEVAKEIPSLERVIVVSYATENDFEAKPDISTIPNAVHFEDFLAEEDYLPVQFEQLPFDHPVYIMFSSGTTGKPKCMVQGAGGILITHMRDLLLHADLRREDKILYITTCSWMMWNWLLSSLAVGATVVLYDGHPSYPNLGAMWKLTQDLSITIFGTSATYINHLRKQGFNPGQNYDLSSLREVLQTGSPLSSEGFEYVYLGIKGDLHFNSITGGTDLNGLFAGGIPTLPVYAGEIQAPSPGMRVKAYDEEGHEVVDQQGELVCEAPSPSMPLYFWNDPDGEKYRSAYFGFYPDLNVWRHGDFVVVHSDTGGMTFYGRSDSVLKPAGVRIGTAEIYNVVGEIEEITDSLAIGQSWQGDQRIILFVRPAEGLALTEGLRDSIRQRLRRDASPRHVPALIVEVPEIPYTFSGKKVESAVTNLVNDRPVLNRDALRNPASLDYFQEILPELQD